MSNQSSGIKRPAKLRMRAEEFLNKNLSAIKKTPPRKVRNLFEDFQIYQNELETRNKELCIAQRELKTALDRYSDLYEFAPVGYFTINDLGMIVEANLVGASFLEVDRASLIGTPFSHFISEDTRETFEFIRRELNEKKVKQRCELKLERKDGTERFCQLECSISQNKDYEFKQIQIAVTDISELKHIEEEKVRLGVQLQQTRRMEAMDTFAGGIAHEFNNLLGIILGNAEMVLDSTAESDPIQGNLKEMRSASLRARNVVRQILAYSRNIKMELKPVRIGRVVEENIKMIRSLCPSEIEISHRSPSKDDIVYADSTQIEQVLLNLCSNAFDAMEDGGGALEIAFDDYELDEVSVGDYQDLKSGNYVRLAVSDTGRGMEADVLERIFDPYFSTKEENDSGMGLAVTYGIVKKHGGDIAVESVPGKGTVIHVLLPVLKDHATSEALEIGPLAQGSERILFVDDEESLVYTVRTKLEKYGYSVNAETSPLRALDSFRESPDKFDLVITDMSMPDIPGDILAKEILKIRPDIPIVLCTGFSERMSEVEAKTMGIREFVMKPALASELVGIIRNVLDQD